MTPTMRLTGPTLIAGTAPCPSPSFLMSVAVAVLAPLFLGVTGGDAALAHIAAAETINDFRARNSMDLLAIVQIITNGFAAADSLCRSMGDELSLSMTLRLRGNAIGLNRAAEQNRRVLRDKRETGPALICPAPVPEPEPPLGDDSPEYEDQPETEALMSDTVAQMLAAEAEARLLRPVEKIAHPEPAEPVTPQPAGHPIPAECAVLPDDDKAIRRIRVKAMLKETGDLTASLRTLPQAERKQAEIRISTLGRLVREAITGEPATDSDDAVVGDYTFIAPPAVDPIRPPPL